MVVVAVIVGVIAVVVVGVVVVVVVELAVTSGKKSTTSHVIC